MPSIGTGILAGARPNPSMALGALPFGIVFGCPASLTAALGPLPCQLGLGVPRRAGAAPDLRELSVGGSESRSGRTVLRVLEGGTDWPCLEPGAVPAEGTGHSSCGFYPHTQGGLGAPTHPVTSLCEFCRSGSFLGLSLPICEWADAPRPSDDRRGHVCHRGIGVLSTSSSLSTFGPPWAQMFLPGGQP